MADYLILQLESWWDSAAYLEGRYPVAPHVNFGGPGPYIHHVYPPKAGTQIYRAGMILHSSLKFWQLVRQYVKFIIIK